MSNPLKTAVTATPVNNDVALAQKDNEQSATFWKNQSTIAQTQGDATIAVEKEQNSYNIQVYVIIAVVVVLAIIFFKG